jgi:methylmalonyl-CoA mutase cobalamin-binding subunit
MVQTAKRGNVDIVVLSDMANLSTSCVEKTLATPKAVGVIDIYGIMFGGTTANTKLDEKLYIFYYTNRNVAVACIREC